MTERLFREERVRRRTDFERAYEQGVRLHGRFMTLFVAPNGGTRCRLGVAATRKLGAAIVRNRAKRLARELFRRQKPPAGLDVIVVPRREMLDVPFASLEKDFSTTLARRDRPGGTATRRPPRRDARARAGGRV